MWHMMKMCPFKANAKADAHVKGTETKTNVTVASGVGWGRGIINIMLQTC